MIVIFLYFIMKFRSTVFIQYIYIITRCFDVKIRDQSVVKCCLLKSRISCSMNRGGVFPSSRFSDEKAQSITWPYRQHTAMLFMLIWKSCSAIRLSERYVGPREFLYDVYRVRFAKQEQKVSQDIEPQFRRYSKISLTKTQLYLMMFSLNKRRIG